MIPGQLYSDTSTRRVLLLLFSTETYRKISNLESELAKLKTQIAAYALAETQDMADVPLGMLCNIHVHVAHVHMFYFSYLRVMP